MLHCLVQRLKDYISWTHVSICNTNKPKQNQTTTQTQQTASHSYCDKAAQLNHYRNVALCVTVTCLSDCYSKLSWNLLRNWRRRKKKREKNHHSDTTGSRGEGIHTNWQISKRKHPHCSWIAWPNSYISLLGGKRRVRFDVCNQWERIHYHPCCCQRQVKKTQIACMQINVRNSGVSQCNLQFPVKGSERASISNRRTKS